MSRINTNIESIRSLGRLNRNQSELALRLERLSTGFRINRGKDDPAGLIASETLRSEIRGIQQATKNSQRVINVLSVTEGALDEVSALVLELRDLVASTANESALSPDEVNANQLQIDNIINAINRVANTTEFAGRKLLNGTLGYALSGQATSQISDVNMFAARLPDNGTVSVAVAVTASAEQAQLAFNNGAATPLSGTSVVELTGSLGTAQITLTSGLTLSEAVTNINQFTSQTGVTASLSGSSGIVLNSVKFGDDEFVTVRSLQGNFIASAGTQTQDFGIDPTVLVNGQQASADGLEIALRTSILDVEMTLTSSFAQQTAASSSYLITGGGAKFQISPSIEGAGKVDLGIPTVATTNLGNSTDGFLSSLGSGGTNDMASGRFSSAELIINDSINQIAVFRGRLGAFQRYVVETNMNSMQVALENVTASESIIRDADIAEEVSKLTRAQILVQSSFQTLAIANQNPQNVLQLLG
jgi:flagellin